MSDQDLVFGLVQEVGEQKERHLNSIFFEQIRTLIESEATEPQFNSLVLLILLVEELRYRQFK